ncbi:winged helix-turn-helix transcriptional regulator [Kribbella sandramycini]|uniref:DNA-binding GntR family transcriptional regulator n=1 Tax=Kribbella sandramycini TaxID=60450 RepID=A0A7Y4L4T8_9ACTN|nr:winged helix-turn-helix domain-containing protein [Kribbella sandramycini]MBB6571722.1 DNA-binding GntR family transcriptional regulator [Kribbella sandramycini]NOL44365.1 winged helix-turn-helix transcriptional regulator [Kribbella sandramycini]
MKLDHTSPNAPYVQVADAIRAAIASGELKPGDKLPSGPKLAKDLDVATMTARRAIDLLRREGLLRSTQGVGVFVTATSNNVSVEQTLQAQLDDLRARVEQLEQLAGRPSLTQPE